VHDDLLALLAATPKTLAHIVAEASAAQLDAAPPGGWSARAILAHLRDDESLCMRTALCRMLIEEVPDVVFLDGGAWEPRRSRARDRKEQLLADFALQRQATLNLLQSLQPDDWARRGRNAEWGEFDIVELVETWVRHDGEHLRELEVLIGETAAEARDRRARMAADHPRPDRD
jgi:hypothetical protein